MKDTSLSRRTLLGTGAAASMMWGNPSLARSIRKDSASPGIVRYQGWAGVVLYPELADALGYMAPLRLRWVGDVSSGPQDLQAAITGDTEFASAFNGAIMKMVGAGAPFKAVFSYNGTNPKEYSGILVPENSPIYTAHDMVGHSIGVNTLRAQSECFVDQYLQSQGISDEDRNKITLVAVPPSLGEAALRHGRVDALVADTFFRRAAVSRGGLRELVSDVAFYGVSNMDSVVLRESYQRDYPQEAAHFVAASAKAIAWSQTAPSSDVVKLMMDIIQKRKRGESTTRLQYWGACSVASRGGVLLNEDFTRFRSWFLSRGDTLTASLPPERFFTNQFNPYQS